MQETSEALLSNPEYNTHPFLATTKEANNNAKERLFHSFINDTKKFERLYVGNNKIQVKLNIFEALGENNF